MIIGTMIAKIGLDTSTFEGGVRKVTTSLAGVQDQMSSLGRTMSLAITTPVMAFAGFAVHAGASAEETQIAFESVFAAIKGDATDTAKGMGRSFGLATDDLMKGMASTGARLKGFGFGDKAALGMSAQLQQMGTDIAAFKGKAGQSAEVVNTLSFSLNGMTRGLRPLGISIDESMIKMRLEADTIRGVRYETMEQAKAATILSLIQEKTKEMQGAWARDTSFAKYWAQLTSSISDYKETAGQMIIDAFQLKDAMQWAKKELDSLIQTMASLDGSASRMILFVIAATAAIGPILLVFSALLAYGPSLAALAVPVSAFLVTLGLVAWAVYEIGNAFGWWDEKWKKVEDGQRTGIQRVIGFFADLVEKFTRGSVMILNIFELIYRGVKAVFQFIADIVVLSLENVSDAFGWLVDQIGSDFEWMSNNWKTVLKLMWEVAKQIGKDIGEVFSNAFSSLWGGNENWDDLFTRQKMRMNELSNLVKDKRSVLEMPDFKNPLLEAANGFRDAVIKARDDFWNGKNMWGDLFGRWGVAIANVFRAAVEKGAVVKPWKGMGGTPSDFFTKGETPMDVGMRQYAGAATRGSVEAFTTTNQRFDETWQKDVLAYLKTTAENTGTMSSAIANEQTVDGL